MDRPDRIRHLTFLLRRRSNLELELLLERIAAGLDWDGLTETELDALETVLNLDDFELKAALVYKNRAPAEVPSGFWRKILMLADARPPGPGASQG